MSFCTAINCMDGRTQLPVIEYLKENFNVTYVDSVTEPGPVKILADNPNSHLAESIFNRVDISVNHHKSRAIAVVAHFDCASNPVEEPVQKKQLAASVSLIKEKYPSLTVIGIWIGSDWTVSEINFES